jgi:hypothetical protein
MLPRIAREAIRSSQICIRSRQYAQDAAFRVIGVVPTTQTLERSNFGGFRRFASESKRVVRKDGHSFVPRKAPVALTETARSFFKALLDTKQEDEDVAGILLNYQQSSSGEPRMVFSFDFVKKSELGPDDEGVSLEVMKDGSPKPPSLSWTDGKPKLYIHHNAFMKVLGSKVDVDIDSLKLTLYDRDGNVMDPND